MTRRAASGRPSNDGAAAGPSWAPTDGEPTIEVLPDADTAAAAAATRMAEALADAVRERGRADWAVTGGSAAVPIYLHLTKSSLRDLVPWDRVHVWWGDDRMVPRDHPLSNRQPLDQVLLRATGPAGLSGSGEDGRDAHVGAQAGVPLREEHIHGIPIDLALGRASSSDEAAREAAATYESALRAAPFGRDAEGFPVLDVVWVGVGPDGHVFSVFPDSPLLDATAWASAVPAPTHVEPHVERVSLHPRFLVAARVPIVVAFGAGKAEVIAQVMGAKRDVRRLPAQLARRPGAVWVMDEAAAAGLGSKPAPAS
jgi:6-phosphogluconolactonase